MPFSVFYDSFTRHISISLCMTCFNKNPTNVMLSTFYDFNRCCSSLVHWSTHTSALVHTHILHPFLTISFCIPLSVYTYHNNNQRALYTRSVLLSQSRRTLRRMHLSKSIYYIKIAFFFFWFLLWLKIAKKDFIFTHRFPRRLPPPPVYVST